MQISRRRFIERAMLFGTGYMLLNACNKKGLSSSQFLPDANILNDSFSQKISLSRNLTILFQGDSITDASRDTTVLSGSSQAALGSGFVYDIAEGLVNSSPTQTSLQIFNRGISGNTTSDLLARWATDCIDLKPDLVSILIGVNDLKYNVTVASYYSNYRQLILETKQKLSSVRFVICEPFLLSNASSAYSSNPALFEQYREAVRELVQEFNTPFIPFYQMLLSASSTQPDSSLLVDGVHPTTMGASLMSNLWLSYVS